MPIAVCNRCGRCHVGNLVFTSAGWQVLFRSDWENLLTDAEWEAWRNNVSSITNRNRRIAEVFEGMRIDY